MGVRHIGLRLAATVHGHDNICATGTETRMPAWQQCYTSKRLNQTDFASVRRARQVGGSRVDVERTSLQLHVIADCRTNLL